jgi:uncharacterized membrane protein YfcA
MVVDPWFYLLAVPALLLTGVSKGGFGAGFGILAVPLMALRLPVPQVAGIMLPILCLMDAISLWGYRGRWDGPVLRLTLPAALVGIGLGTLGFGLLPEPWIRLLIGLIAVGFTLQRWLVPPRLDRPAGLQPVKGFVCAMVSGFTSFIANAGGPPYAVYLLPLGLDKTRFVGTTVVFFAIVNLSKVPSYGWLGLLNGTNLTTSLALSPVAPIGIGLGLWLHRRLDAALFYRVCYLFLFAVGLKLVYDSLTRIL